MVGPSSAKQADTSRRSGSWSSLATALAIAEASTLEMAIAASRSTNWRISLASTTCLPRMRSSTSRALYADMRMWRAVARVPGRSLVLTPKAISADP